LKAHNQQPISASSLSYEGVNASWTDQDPTDAHFVGIPVTHNQDNQVGETLSKAIIDSYSKLDLSQRGSV